MMVVPPTWFIHRAALITVTIWKGMWSTNWCPISWQKFFVPHKQHPEVYCNRLRHWLLDSLLQTTPRLAIPPTSVQEIGKYMADVIKESAHPRVDNCGVLSQQKSATTIIFKKVCIRICEDDPIIIIAILKWIAKSFSYTALAYVVHPQFWQL